MADTTKTESAIELVEEWSAHNYHPLPVVVESADGVWVRDVEGNELLDLLSGYSALNFGHRHPRLIAAAKAQLDRVTLTGRAFHNDQLGPLAEALAKFCGMEAILPMNSGAEAVETAIKLSRKWGYRVKGIPDGKANVIVCNDNFHGRTTTIVGFSSDPDSYRDFGPFTPGFKSIPYGDIEALQNSIDENTAAFMVEPIQGEAGVIIPPEGYLKAARELCAKHNVLFIADEIQSGFGRTGKTFAVDHDDIKPDIFILGKALGGGIMPLSAVVTSRSIMDVIRPGEHGSTFGGNPLACAVGLEAIALMSVGDLQENATAMGARLLAGLQNANLSKVTEIRARGLWFGIDIDSSAITSRQASEALLAEGLMVKDAHAKTLRLSPPLIINANEVDMVIERVAAVLG